MKYLQPKINDLLKNQKGQAMPLAAIALLVMALGVIASLNLGQAIYEKIKLQNAADASAYSLAAIEARALNYVALTNRTQIVHYNSAMAVSAYLTYAGYCLSIIVTIKDLVADLADVILWGCKHLPAAPICVKCPYCAAYPWVAGAANVLYGIAKVAEVAYKIEHFLATQYIETMGLMNRYIIWHMQLARLAEVNAYLINGMEDVIKKMYPKNGFTLDDNAIINRYLNALLNSIEFRQTFDPGSGVNPGIVDLLVYGLQDFDNFNQRKTPENRDAARIMTELANASRSHKAIYNRKDSLNFITGVVNIHGSKKGTTKMIPPGAKPTPRIKELRKPNYNYIIGDSIASDDYVSDGWAFATIPFPPAFVVFRENAMKAVGDAIVAAKEESDQYHYGYILRSGTSAPKGDTGVVNGPPFEHDPKKSFRKNKECSSPQAHEFPGISPYFKFNTRVKLGSKANNRDYNQPSVWIFLNIPPERIQTKGKNKKPYFKKFKWKNGSEEAELDTTIGGDRNSTLIEGLTVVSRAMVYYHRPGNWGEHPNLFNPFWRAKLHPIGEKLTKLFDEMTKGITGHPSGSGGSGGSEEEKREESLLGKLVKNGLRNFLNDVFFGIVTGVMTH